MNTFIKAAECWIPAADQPILEFGYGVFGPNKQFESISQELCFGMGEGLPGQAWEEGRPVLLKNFDSQHFRRGAAAKAAGFQCAVAVPCYQGDKLMAVLVVYLGDASGLPAGVELWKNAPRVTSDLTLLEAFYGRHGEELESEAKDTFLPRGTGLPGVAWQKGEAIYMADLASARRFLRAHSVVRAGLQSGLAFPSVTPTDTSYVVALLSGAQTPLARQIESWTLTAGEMTPVLMHQTGAALKTDPSLIELAVQSGRPVLAHEGDELAQFVMVLPLGGEAAVSNVLVLHC